MRVLLLNPPAEETVLRDYFCSKTTKSNYLYPPIDLVMLSGILASEHEVAVLDAVAERLSPRVAEARIEALAPEVIVSLVASVTWPEDRAFLADQARRGRRVLVIGDVLQEDAARRLADEPWIEAALHDFTSRDVLAHLAGRASAPGRMTVRGSDAAPREAAVRRKPDREYRVPRPLHELFPERGYRFSFARSSRFASVLTDWGCPYPCTFCVMSTLGFSTRPVADVLEEIDSLRARGVRELFFLDQTFGVRRERALELCSAFAQRGDLSWTAFTRPDTGAEALLRAMRAGGCHTGILGVESASDEVLRATRKGYSTDQVGGAFERARAAGLRTVGTFLIGLPEETGETLDATLEWALRLDPDFLSLNVAVPRFSTPFRRDMLASGRAQREELVMDQAGSTASMPTAALDREQVTRLKRRAVRRFYLRPSYLWRRVRALRSLHELKSQAREGFALLARNL